MRTCIIVSTIVLFSAFSISRVEAQGAGPAENVQPPPSSSTAESPPEQPTPAPPEPPPAETAEQPASLGPLPPAEPSQPPAEQPPPRETRPPAQPAYSDSPDNPPEEKGGGEKGEPFDMPPFSIRLDPFNWLLEGRLGLELEIGVWKFISVEMVPVFVVNDSPPIFNFAGEPDPLHQSSNGLGPISGTSLGVGFWLNGKPLEGYVLRLIFTNYGYTYKTKDGSVTIDKVNFTERRLFGYFGSHMKWGVFTISGGIGLGYELNQQERCFDETATSVRDGAKKSGCGGEQLIAIKSDLSEVYDLNGWAHPVYLMGRFSLGVVIDL